MLHTGLMPTSTFIVSILANVQKLGFGFFFLEDVEFICSSDYNNFVVRMLVSGTLLNT